MPITRIKITQLSYIGLVEVVKAISLQLIRLFRINSQQFTIFYRKK